MNREKNVPIPILYEDNHLLVVEKPVNIPTQADASGDLDLLTILKQDLKIRYKNREMYTWDWFTGWTGR